MIISHQHRFIFAAVPKTGTHSVRQALREHLSADDVPLAQRQADLEQVVRTLRSYLK